MNRLIHGDYTWTDQDDSLHDVSLYLASSIPGDELTIDTIDVTVDCSVETSAGRTLSVDPRTFAYGTMMEYYHNSTRLARLYFSYAKRTGKYLFTLHGISAVGLLDKLPHPGGIYTGQTADALLADLFGGVAPYTVAADVAELKIYGWLPYATRRENLHQFLFAHGAALLKNSAGNPHIAFLTDGEGTPVPDDRIFSGGQVSYNTLATGVDVTEHTFVALAGDQVVTLFDNTDGSGAVMGETVIFDGPHHDLTATGSLRILSSGVNFAVLTGVGTLQGKQYTHQTKIVSERVEEVTGEENLVTVTDATLVSVSNSRNVAKRTLSFYSCRRVVTMDIESTGERPGDMLTFSDPFDESTKGLLQSLEFSMAQILRASATVITDYIPKWFGNKYNAYDVITTNGTYTIPAGVEDIMVLLIGGGRGGWSGLSGLESDPSTASTLSRVTSVTDYTETASGYGTVKGGEGGEAGAGGLGGKVYRVELSVTPGQSFPVTIGTGGAGGVYSSIGSIQGSVGTASKFGTLSSESGVVMDAGYADVISGTIYAAPGKTGIPGGKGSGGMENPQTNAEKQSVVDGPPVTGPDGKVYTVGVAPTLDDASWSGQARISAGGIYAAISQCSAQIGSSGGAAVGANGQPGGKPSVSAWKGTAVNDYVAASAYGGDGGDGGNATAPAKATGYGVGGIGGNGGGGAGGGGYAFCIKRIATGYSFTAQLKSVPGDSGTPGKGSNGGVGANGCMVVFYRKTT